MKRHRFCMHCVPFIQVEVKSFRWYHSDITLHYINCSALASGSKSIKMISTRVISFLTNQLAEFAMFQCSMSQSKSILSRNIFGSYSAIFGNLRKSRKMFGNIRTTFGQHFENFRKSSEMVGNLRKIVKNIVISKFI